MSFLFEQLPLGVQLRDDATFDNYYAADNALVIDQLRSQLNAGERYIYLHGSKGCGRSHLLQAACHQAQQMQAASVFLPLEQLYHYDPSALFDGLEQLALVCIDDIHCVAGQAHWERPLFDLYNRLADSGTHLLVSAHCAVRELPIALADLSSRLSWGAVYHIQALSDEQCMQALQFRAARRGLQISDDVAQYIVYRSQRDTGSLLAILDTLDNASLKEQRRLTVPFVKSALKW